MKKRWIAGTLAGALALCLPTPALAAISQEDTAKVLDYLEIMEGYPDGQLHLDQPVTRAEFTKMSIAASPLGDSVGDVSTISPYPDVPREHWAAPYVEVAKNTGLIKGFLDGTFRPDQTITLAEGVTIAQRLLGYQDADFPGMWPSGQMALYHTLELDEQITCGQNDAMTRQDTMQLFYNMLITPAKDGTPYLARLGLTLDHNGEVDQNAIVNAELEGPVILEGNWTGEFDHSVTASATVYRNGRSSSLEALQPYDVLYYSWYNDTLWAYSTKKSGQLQAVSPNRVSPTSVTVAGQTYPLGTPEVIHDLSTLASHTYQVGDPVTLLLGRDDTVAAIMTTARSAPLLWGIVSAVTDSTYVDADGHEYTAKSVVVTASDGSTYTYPVDSKIKWKAGDLVQVATGETESVITRLKRTSTEGHFSKDGTMLGRTPLAEDVEILDTREDGSALRVYPRRMAGIWLEKEDVLFSHTNLAGELDVLILDDVTGDMDAYGLMRSVKNTDAGMMLMGQYQYDVGQQPYFYVLQNGNWNVTTGPVHIEGSPNAPDSITMLDKAELIALEDHIATTAGHRDLPVSENVQVYEYVHDRYQFSSLERVRAGYKLTGYSDGPVKEGGCIRVILAKPDQSPPVKS